MYELHNFKNGLCIFYLKFWLDGTLLPSTDVPEGVEAVAAVYRTKVTVFSIVGDSSLQILQPAVTSMEESSRSRSSSVSSATRHSPTSGIYFSLSPLLSLSDPFKIEPLLRLLSLFTSGASRQVLVDIKKKMPLAELLSSFLPGDNFLLHSHFLAISTLTPII